MRELRTDHFGVYSLAIKDELDAVVEVVGLVD